ncbi:complement component 1, q subcomponent-like 4 like [Chanos chanos]|uniref:Complement component 1, q subcomponent-like 4 like n=1 Tax=Chanos chanos TaxID=29144 RepID=A0A6J2VAB1_CHACN|nr:cerebellin-3-like [Chanos chanos]
MMKMAPILQSVLMCFVLAAKAQDITLTSFDILYELNEIKSLFELKETIEQTLKKQSDEMVQLKARVQELEETNEAMKNALEETTMKIQEQENHIKLLQSSVTEPTSQKRGKDIAFSASLQSSGLGNIGPYNSEIGLVYKKVLTNIGKAYNSETGIFTAPLKGVYYFRFYAHAKPGTKMAVSLYRNDSKVSSIFSWKPVTNGNASNGVVLILNSGDQVCTRLWGNAWVYDDDNNYTSFSGFLLFPL